MHEKLTAVPDKPGIYIFKDKNSRVLYVGKAKGLRSRLRSYFQKSSSLDARKSAMIRSISDFEYTVTSNELEALVLEANLIKQYRPRYNILLRDDKNYPYLKLTIQETWPRLEVVRKVKKDGARYYGPYVPAGAMWETLSFIRTRFLIPACRHSFEKRMRPCIKHQIKRCSAPCAGLVEHGAYMAMIAQIRLLLEGKNRKLLGRLEKKMQELSGEMRYEEAAVVRDLIEAIKKISESQKAAAPGLGDVDVIGVFRTGDEAVFRMLFCRNGIMIGSKDFPLRHLAGEADGSLMKTFIEQFYGREVIPPDTVLCSGMPDDAKLLSAWLSGKKGAGVKIAVPARGMKRKLVEMAEENAALFYESSKAGGSERLMQELRDMLALQKIPDDIGAFDISNFSGKEPVGSYVYWTEGEFAKEHYRHIRMDSVKGPDDYAMMKEMIKRTFTKSAAKKHSIDPSRPASYPSRELKVPDLVIIDGGKGQLEAGRMALDEIGIDTELVAVAKDPDRVFTLSAAGPVSLEDGRKVSLLLKRIRDEAHRFAVSYHKKLRTKKIFESPLLQIHGVGKQRRFALLRHFGSIDAIRKADAEAIAKLRGFNRTVAEKILESLAEKKKG